MAKSVFNKYLNVMMHVLIIWMLIKYAAHPVNMLLKN